MLRPALFVVTRFVVTVPAQCQGFASPLRALDTTPEPQIEKRANARRLEKRLAWGKAVRAFASGGSCREVLPLFGALTCCAPGFRPAHALLGCV